MQSDSVSENGSGAQKSLGASTGSGSSIVSNSNSEPSGGESLVSQPGPQGFVLVQSQASSMDGTTNSSRCAYPSSRGEATVMQSSIGFYVNRSGGRRTAPL